MTLPFAFRPLLPPAIARAKAPTDEYDRPIPAASPVDTALQQSTLLPRPIGGGPAFEGDLSRLCGDALAMPMPTPVYAPGLPPEDAGAAAAGADRRDRPGPTADELALRAIAAIHDGMTVGLGTGRAATRGIRALAAEAAARGWSRIRCVATSDRSAELALSLGLAVVPMDDVHQVDLLFDGADEVAPNLMMLKGRGGAMTREKIVAEAAVHRVYLVDQTKCTQRIGERFALPIEILAYGRASVVRRLEHLGLEVELRRESDDERTPGDAGKPYRTDEGNLVLDCRGLPSGADWAQQLRSLERTLNDLPGIVDHGLFLSHADVVYIEDPDTGAIEERRRSTH